jgi:NTE family protein
MELSVLSGLLSEVPALGALTTSQLEGLSRVAETRKLRRGDILVRRGALSDTLNFVISGRFSVDSEDGGEPIAEIGRGEPIGEIGFFARVPRTFTVTALRDSEVLTIRRDAFDKVGDAIPGVRDAVIKSLAMRLAETKQVARQPCTARTIAVLPAGQSGLSKRFFELLRQVFDADQRAIFLTRAVIEERFGDSSLDDPATSSWLNALEMVTDFIFYIADETLTDWTAKCVRQADVLLLAAAAAADKRLSPSESFAFSLHRPASRRLVILHEARTAVATGTSLWLHDRDVFMHHHVSLQDADDVERLRRYLSGRAVGFVAGGGGALGSAHLGVYKAFSEAGAVFDVFGGTSVGAAMAAALAMGLDAEDIDSKTHNIFVTNRAFRRFTLPYYGLLDHKAFDRALRAEYGDLLIEDLWKPLFAISANLADNNMMIHRRGPVWQAVRASASIPGVFPPYFTPDGKMLVDGALVDNVPLAFMKALKSGPNVVVALQENAPKGYLVDYESIPGPREWLMKVLNPFSFRRLPQIPSAAQVIVLSMLANSRQDLPLSGEDLLIRPDLPSGVQWTNWDRHTEVLTSAYRGAVAMIRSRMAESDAGLMAVIAATKPVWRLG